MRYRVLLVAAGLLAASASVYGQAKLAGKWQTDNVPAALEAQKNAPAAAEAGGGAAAAEAAGRRSFWICRWMRPARSAGP